MRPWTSSNSIAITRRPWLRLCQPPPSPLPSRCRVAFNSLGGVTATSDPCDLWPEPRAFHCYLMDREPNRFSAQCQTKKATPRHAAFSKDRHTAIKDISCIGRADKQLETFPIKHELGGWSTLPRRSGANMCSCLRQAISRSALTFPQVYLGLLCVAWGVY